MNKPMTDHCELRSWDQNITIEGRWYFDVNHSDVETIEEMIDILFRGHKESEFLEFIKVIDGVETLIFCKFRDQ